MKNWIAFQDRIEVIEDSDVPRVIAIAPTSAYVPNIPLGASQVAANMRLMAAAPELLAACKALLAGIASITSLGGFGMLSLSQAAGLQSAIDQAHAAITRAEGQSSS